MRKPLALVLLVSLPLPLAACGDEERPRSPDEVAAATPVDSFKVSHILISYRNAPGFGQRGGGSPAKRDKQSAKLLAESVLAELKNGGSFDDLWKRFTDERKTGEKPPEMTVSKSGPSGFVAEFEKAARALQPGKISPEPVESSFGYHIIRRLP